MQDIIFSICDRNCFEKYKSFILNLYTAGSGERRIRALVG